MKFYHGTRDGNLKELTLNHWSGKIFLTTDYGTAFLYGASPMRCYGFNKKTGKVIICERAKDGFKTMYSGKKCYIFSCEADDIEKIDQLPMNSIYVSNKPVTLGEREEISDCYEKLLELGRQGAIELDLWDNHSPEEQARIKEQFFKDMQPQMADNKKRFREVYDVCVSLYPELAIQDEGEV